jgi:hypothetical protein
LFILFPILFIVSGNLSLLIMADISKLDCVLFIFNKIKIDWKKQGQNLCYNRIKIGWKKEG